MTYCVGIMLDAGLIFASDSRTHAEVDNFASFCKMTVFERSGDRVIVLLSSGNLAGTQAVISVLKQRTNAKDGVPNLWSAESMFDAAILVSDAMRDVNPARRPTPGRQRHQVQRLVHTWRPAQGRTAAAFPDLCRGQLHGRAQAAEPKEWIFAFLQNKSAVFVKNDDRKKQKAGKAE